MIGSNSKIFATAVLNLGAALPAQQLSYAIKKLSLEALEGLVDMTPVDTGRAKGNWNVTTAGRSMAKATDSRMDKTGGNSIATGTEKILRATAKNRVPKSVYITNNVDYIEDLENGNSKQHNSQGMLKVTVNRLTLKHSISEVGEVD